MALKAQYLSDLNTYMVTGWERTSYRFNRTTIWDPGFQEDTRWIEVECLEDIEVKTLVNVKPPRYVHVNGVDEMEIEEYRRKHSALSILAYDQDALDKDVTIVLDRQAHEDYKVFVDQWNYTLAENKHEWLPAKIETITNGRWYSGSKWVSNTMLQSDGKTAKIWIFDKRRCVNDTIFEVFRELGTKPVSEGGDNTYETAGHSFHEFTKAWGHYLFTAPKDGEPAILAKGNYSSPAGTLEDCLAWQKDVQEKLRNHILSYYRMHYLRNKVDGVLLSDLVPRLSQWISTLSGLRAYEKDRATKSGVIRAMREFKEKLCQIDS